MTIGKIVSFFAGSMSAAAPAAARAVKNVVAQTSYLARSEVPRDADAPSVTLRRVSPLDVSPLDVAFTSAPTFTKLSKETAPGYDAGLDAGLSEFASLTNAMDIGRLYTSLCEEHAKKAADPDFLINFSYGLATALQALRHQGSDAHKALDPQDLSNSLIAFERGSFVERGDRYAGRILADCNGKASSVELGAYLETLPNIRAAPLSEDARIHVLRRLVENSSIADRSGMIEVARRVAGMPHNPLALNFESAKVQTLFTKLDKTVDPLIESLAGTNWSDAASVQATVEKWGGPNMDPRHALFVRDAFMRWIKHPGTSATDVERQSKVFVEALNGTPEQREQSTVQVDPIKALTAFCSTMLAAKDVRFAAKRGDTTRLDDASADKVRILVAAIKAVQLGATAESADRRNTIVSS